MPRQKIWAGELKSYGVDSTIIHVCGDIHPILEDLGQTGASCLDIDYMVDMREARIRSGLAVRGNIDPSAIMLQGTVDDVQAAAKKLLEETHDLTGIVLGTGCDVPPPTPNENVKMLTTSAKKYGTYLD